MMVSVLGWAVSEPVGSWTPGDLDCPATFAFTADESNATAFPPWPNTEAGWPYFLNRTDHWSVMGNDAVRH